MAVFFSEDGGSSSLQDVRIFLLYYVTSHPKRHFASNIVRVILTKKGKYVECEMRLRTEYRSGIMKERSYLGDLDMNRRIILKWILKAGISRYRMNVT